MDWIQSIQMAVDYMEEHLLEDLTVEKIAEKVYSSSTHFGIDEACDRAKLVALSGEGNRFCWTDGVWMFGFLPLT